jgi:hypothetical protein
MIAKDTISWIPPPIEIDQEMFPVNCPSKRQVFRIDLAAGDGAVLTVTSCFSVSVLERLSSGRDLLRGIQVAHIFSHAGDDEHKFTDRCFGTISPVPPRQMKHNVSY